jgi:hypothetical protein
MRDKAQSIVAESDITQSYSMNLRFFQRYDRLPSAAVRNRQPCG